MSELPSGWAEARIGDLADLNPKQAFDDEVVAGFVPMSHAPTTFRDKLRFDERPWGDIKKAYTNFKDGDVIFAKVTPCFENGKAAFVEGLPNGIGAGSSEFFVLRPSCENISAKYLLGVVKSRDFLREGAANMTGAVGLRRVPKQFVESYPVLVPPAAEQTRIAAKLDELLAQVDTLKARIDGIPALLKRFRQSVLAAAVSGRLTEEWRVQNVGLADEASLPENQHEDIWPKISLKSLIASLEQGWSPKCESDSVAEAEEAWAVIKTTSIQPIEFYPSENKRLPESLSPRPELSVQAGDLLITRAGPRSRAAVCCYVKKTQPYLMVCDKAYRFRTQASVMDGRLLCLFLNSPQYISLLDDLKTGISESGMNLTMRKFQELQIPHPSLEEQAEIVRRVEQLFAFADQVEAKVGEAKTRIDRLTQSILAKAFRGELVPQDPNDEPASELLARITAQRANATKAKRGRKSG